MIDVISKHKTDYDTIYKKDILVKIQLYKNKYVLEKFKSEWCFSDEEVNEIFSETKKFLYLSVISPQYGFNMEIQEPLLIIDQMWHTFMQFTKEYAQFCEDHFGHYLHHQPFTKSHQEKLTREFRAEEKDYSEEKRLSLSKQIDLIWRVFGVDCVKRWYVDYAIDYSQKALLKAIKPQFEDKQSVPLDRNSANQMSFSDIKLALIGSYIAAVWCGGHGCGRYCTCNSGILS